MSLPLAAVLASFFSAFSTFLSVLAAWLCYCAALLVVRAKALMEHVTRNANAIVSSRFIFINLR